jgi:hypothetical protein
MKKHFYLLAMVFAFAIFNSANAKADGLLGGLLGGGSTPAPGSGSTPLPINGGIVFLVIIAVVIGFVAIKKAKLGSVPSKG